MTTTARHFVTGWAARNHLPTETTDTLELLTSEVVGNAVVHGTGPISLTIGSPRPQALPWAGPSPLLPPDAVLVQVHDTSTHQPQVQPLTPDSTGGRGLAMVELLARQWGVSRPDEAATSTGPDGADDPDGADAVARAGVGQTSERGVRSGRRQERLVRAQPLSATVGTGRAPRRVGYRTRSGITGRVQAEPG